MNRCNFCGAHFTPPEYFRAPSGACDRCWLEIQAQISATPEPVFTRENMARVNYRPEKWWVQ